MLVRLLKSTALVFAISLLLPPSGSAREIIVPAGLEYVDTNHVISLKCKEGFRFQQLMPGASIGPGSIHMLRLRESGSQRGVSPEWTGVTIRMATTNQTPSDLTNDMDMNLPPNAMEVYSGDLVIREPSIFIPFSPLRTFDVVLPLQQPFEVSETENLLLDIEVTGCDSELSLFVPSTNSAAGLASAVAGGSDLSQASFVDQNGGAIIKFIIQPESSSPHDIFVPIAGSVVGADQSEFRTETRVHNPSRVETISVSASFLPVGGQANTSGVPTADFDLQPGETRRFLDVASELFNTSGLGAMRFQADWPIVVSSRIFTESGCEDPTGGTFGQFNPARKRMDASLVGTIPHLRIDQEFRSNIGFLNPSEEDIEVSLLLMDGSGTEIADQKIITIGALGAIGPQNIAQFFDEPDLTGENLTVLFGATKPVLAYGSGVDNTTGDQIFITPTPAP